MTAHVFILVAMLAQPDAQCSWHTDPLVVASAGPYQMSGESVDKYDIVFVAEGFMDDPEDSQLFHHKIDIAIAAISNTPPLRRCAFNFWAVRLVSRDRGVDHELADPVICKDTALNFQLGEKDLEDRIGDWILYSWTVDSCMAAAERATDDWDLVCVLVNDTLYGGMADKTRPIIAASCGASFDSVLVHELGHRLGGLEDEYATRDSCFAGQEPLPPNISRMTDRNSAKWADLIATSTPIPTNLAVLERDPENYRAHHALMRDLVGLWQGAADCQKCVYRPQRRCMMNQVGDPFCKVCSRALTEVLESYCATAPVPVVTRSWTCTWEFPCHTGMVYRIRLPSLPIQDLPPDEWNRLVAVSNAPSDTIRIDLDPLVGVRDFELVDRSGRLIAIGNVGPNWKASVRFAVVSVCGPKATVQSPFYLQFSPHTCPSAYDFSSRVYFNGRLVDTGWCE
jgi:hypothetical protein